MYGGDYRLYKLLKKGNAGINTSDATATSEDILEGKTAYAQNGKITGTIETYDGSYEGNATDLKITDGYYLFYNNHRIDQIDNILKLCDNVTDMSYMFYQCSNLTNLDLNNLDTSNVTNMNSMFSGCSGLTTLDVSSFNTSSVTKMDSMFYYCSGLTTLDVSNFDTSKVTNMSYMFYSCSNLTNLNLSNFDTSNVTNMGYMFQDCNKNLTNLDLSNFDTSKVTYMGYMFYDCSSLTSLNLSSFDMNKVTNVNSMFSICPKLTNLQFGFNLGKGYTSKSNNYSNYKLNLSNSTSLTYDSLMSVINNLYDLNLTYNVANGGKLYRQSLVLGATNLAKLTEEEIAIATNKGWNVS